MKRVVSVWLPAWPISRLKRAEPQAVPSRQPFALVESGVHGLAITAVNGAAARAGIEPGTALSDARAAHPTLVSRAAEPENDRIALLKLARWAGRYGPNRHVDGGDGLWIDITGVAHLFGGEENLLDDVTRRLSSFGVAVQAGLADTLGAAHGLARFGCPPNAAWSLAPADRTREAIGSLPVEALRLDAPRVLLLKRLGLRRIGQLYDIPRDSLARRFRSSDIAAAVLVRLDQMLGLADEPRRPMQPPPVLSVARAFAEPLISSEALEGIAAELAAELAAALAAKDLGARTVRLTFYRADGTAGTATAAMSTPCREAAHMMALLKEKFAGIDAGFGIDLLRLDAVRVAKRNAMQNGFAEPASTLGGDPAALVDRLANRFGSDAITMLRPRGSHIPERAETRRPAIETLTAASSSRLAYAPPWPYPKGPPRPAFVLARPEPIEVIAEVPDGPPARFIWRRVERRVARAEGPERIAPEWWRTLYLDEDQKRPRPRDYYRVEDHDGAAYWVFRHGLYGGEEESAPPSWFVHGLFA
ncbi:MAG TPA: DNA polymerase Y family protein [Hyphomicrobium sp.]|jgi:protein ImuB|uniref:Y-family DNA polymerase n=1 Tax=Hyphomicrobium sp. TaxID=82 RepID=UPI002D040277|nr:DNA polymerase Y family protein [Hyphomicrobium sp.]HXE02856.1 DNA polymerase Y family protein [Hyphomicrobium sp.]